MKRTILLATAAAAGLGLAGSALAQSNYLTDAEMAALESALDSDNRAQVQAILENESSIGENTREGTVATLNATERAALMSAMDTNDFQQVDYILEGGLRDGERVADIPNEAPSSDELAELAGVEEGRFSRAELAALISAQNSDDRQMVDYILDGGLKD